MGQQLSVYLKHHKLRIVGLLMLMVQDDLRLNFRYILFIWCWARKMSQVQTKDCLNGIIGQRNQETLSDWSYVREIFVQCLNDAQPVGGPGTVVAYSWTKHTCMEDERLTLDV